MNICIYGASSAELKKIYYEKTEELGRLIGKRGHGLVFGGGKEGLMGAAARGVDREKGYEEFFEILTLKSLGRIDRPIVLYNINGYYDSMRALLEYTAGEKFMARDVVDMCRFMKDPEEILDYIENYRNYGGKL